MINMNFKNIAHAVKEWAIRFFSIYFFVYALLITFLVISGQDYYFAAIVCLLLLILNTFLKTQLDKKFTYVNIGIKYAICLVIFLITYFVLSIMSNNLFDAIIFSLSVLSLFGIKETCSFLVEWINKLVDKKVEEPSVVKSGKTYLSKMFSLDKVWNKDKFDDDEVSKMLYEFINISNDNQMGHVVVRSMTNTDENNVQKIYVKAKEGYHIIIKGKLEYIAKMCSDVITNDSLLEISDETINSFADKLNEYDYSDAVFCAFKEVKDIAQEEENNYILAGCGIYESEMIETPVKKQRIKISPAKSHNVIIGNVFLLFVATVLLTANVFASLFDAFVFNCCEIITGGILCSILAVLISFCGDLPTVTTKCKCIIFVFSVLSVCISYFVGRYIMLNADYANDLFYVVTANIMTTASLICYVMLILLTTIEYNNWSSRIIATLCCFVLLSNMFAPFCCKLMQGYSISYIYISIAYLISLAGVFVSSILYFILRKKNNGTEISN